MPAKVTIKIDKGEGEGRAYEYTGPETLFIGRAADCGIIVRDETVSRYHCMVQIQPPAINFHDFGSLNGTRLNGKLVVEGRGATGLSIDEARKQEPIIFQLKNGDTLGLSRKTELKIDVYEPQHCSECLKELNENEKGPVCKSCLEKGNATVIEKTREPIKAGLPKNANACSICGSPLDGSSAGGGRICKKCRDNPQLILEYMLRNAGKGNSGVTGIKGYRKIKQLGKGGMGAVWLVEDENTGNRAAMKVMLSETAADENSRALFLREAAIGEQLKHENIINQYQSGNDGDTFYILQEVCMGGSVDNLIEKMDTQKLPLEIATDITLQVLEGLVYAHKAQVAVKLSNGNTQTFPGVVHRDIKPGNFFIAGEFPGEKYFDIDHRTGKLAVRSFRASEYRRDRSSRPKIRVADFGLAKSFEAAGLTDISGGEVKGTPVFMPRQQIINCRYAKPDVDVWAVAASYYFMLTGQFPKLIKSQRTMWQDVLKNPAVPIREHDSSIDKKLARVIDTALIDNPHIGYQSAGEFKKALEEVL
jgi:serine/threonine-protein kinase